MTTFHSGSYVGKEFLFFLAEMDFGFFEDPAFWPDKACENGKLLCFVFVSAVLFGPLSPEWNGEGPPEPSGNYAN